MGWQGAAPDSDRLDQLPAGFHRVKVTDVRKTDKGSIVAVLSNRRGEVAEFCPPDIAPMTREEREAYKQKHGRYHDGFKFWRLMGAADYPSVSYWSALPKEREPRMWDTEADLREIMSLGTEFWVETTEWEDNKGRVKAQIQGAKSLTRHAAEIGERDPGPGGSKILPPKPVEPVQAKWGGGAGADTEVPFAPGKWWR